jgi:hypothetical protein
MTPARARTVINERLKERRGNAPVAEAPSSIAEVTEILRRDEVERFDAALSFIGDQAGADAWTLRAKIELAWAEMQLLIAKVLEEILDRRALEASVVRHKNWPGDGGAQLGTVQPGSPSARTTETIKALRVLARGHVEAGGELVDAMVQRQPQNATGYLLRAHYHRLKREWNRFDADQRQAENRGGESVPAAKLARAMEDLQRYAAKAQARAQLEALRNDYVRAQAVLVLIQDDIEATHAELTKLRATNPTHPVVLVAGPLLEEQYEFSRRLGQKPPGGVSQK